MKKELISRKTRNEFREFLVGWTLREIDMEFEAADISYDDDYTPNVSGVRRTRIEQYYHSLDFTNPSDVRKLLDAYENVLLSAEARLSNDMADNEHPETYIKPMINCLEKDGYIYESKRIRPVNPELSILPEGKGTIVSISKQTKLNIIDAMRLENIHWAGRMAETEFLNRLYDLSKMPSKDHRFNNAYSDIYQHRELNPYDWPDDWLFSDHRFQFFESTEEKFIRFLCITVHPLARPDTSEAEQIVNMFNESLQKEGWEIIEQDYINKKPVFVGRRLINRKSPALSAAKDLVSVLNADYIYQQVKRMENSADTDPELAIGTAKEFVETICKTILAECGKEISKNADMMQLMKAVRKELQFLPEDISAKAKGAEAIKRLLNNLGTIVQNLAELRSLYGTGHGKTAKAKGLHERHAHLAVGAASTLGVYLFETYNYRKDIQNK